jgi:hypothetical protein
MTEAEITRHEAGWREPEGDGWYVANAKGRQWFGDPFGFYSDFQKSRSREDFLPRSRSHEARGCHTGRAVRDAGPRALVV